MGIGDWGLGVGGFGVLGWGGGHTKHKTQHPTKQNKKNK